MGSKQKLVLGVTATVFVLAIAAAAALYYLLTKSLPETSGYLQVAGLSQPVEVYRDPAGTPHLLAQTEYDVYFAAGYVQAQDRLWQMDMTRRYGLGRLSEVLGSKAVPVDKLMRTIGISRIADSLLVHVSTQTRNLLDAYSAGVNACIDHMKGRYPVEFDLLQYDPEPWLPEHSLIVTRLLGWELALSWWVDLTLNELVRSLGSDKAMEVFPWYAEDAPVIVPPASNAENSTRSAPASRYTIDASAFQDNFRTAQRLLAAEGSAIGSNSWAITGSKSSSGRAILANDPHLPHMQPSPWYAMHLSAPGLNVAGVSIPGTPIVVIGRNDHISWGLTNMMADDADFYIERVNYRDSTWEYQGNRLPMSVYTDSIFVSDSLPVTLTVYETGHGPVITSVFPQEGIFKSERFTQPTAMSMRWTGREMTDEILALYRVNHAANWEQFTTALSDFGVPGQNVVYADIDGNIGYCPAVLLPLRGDASPVLPGAGWSGQSDWRGFIAYDELPRRFNPSDGYLATANNKLSRDFPHHISSLWESDSRISRILHLLEEETTFSAPDFRYIQMDMLSPYAATIRDAWVNALRQRHGKSALLTRVMNRLAAWDLRMHASSTEASIYNVAYRHLLLETFQDEMGPELFRNYTFLSNLPTRVLPKLLADTATTWFDNTATSTIETREDILVRSIQLALAELTDRFGPKLNDWQWGKLHTVEFRHPLGEVELLGNLFNVGPFAVGGNNTTVNNGEFSFTDPYRTRVGPSMRFVADMGNRDSSLLVLTTGQSGQPLSKHYSDQSAFWQIGAYRALVHNPALVRNAGWELLVLEP